MVKHVNILSKLAAQSIEILPDILFLDFGIVNACIVGTDDEWALVDTGPSNSYDYIRAAAIKRFTLKPKAIILTHGHFDHAGSAGGLAEYWDVPIYAHPLEMPYLSGARNYPAADPDADEETVARMSPPFSHSTVNVRFRLADLPKDGSVPGMPGWKWVHTPGHTEGHVSLFRESDRTLIAGDAFTTTEQEPLLKSLTRRGKIQDPPAGPTNDLEKAKNSVAQLRGLDPYLAIPSHGKPMRGEKLKERLDSLTMEFNDVTVPDPGRFTDKHE